MTFAALAATAGRIATRRSRRFKVAQAAALLADCPDEAELAAAARFLAGRAVPATAPHTLQVGWATVERAALAVLPWDSVVWRACARATGEAAEALGKLLEGTPARPAAQSSLAPFGLAGPAPTPLVTCADVARWMEDLARLPTPARRVEVLADAFRRLSPPEVRTLAALVLGDWRIGASDALVEEAVAAAFGRGLAEVRLAAMLVGDVGRASVLARADALASARLLPGHPLQFMLASPIDAPPEEPDAYLLEDKWDGVRTQLHRSDGRVRLFSRTLDEVTGRFPEIVEAAAGLPTDLVLDGEVVAWGQGRAAPFSLLQRRLGRKEAGPDLRAHAPVRFVAYDALLVGGRETFPLGLEERRELLADALRGAPASLVLSAARSAGTPEEVERAFADALARGNEGLVLKRRGSAYEFGRRGRAWLKYKKSYATLDVVVTAAEMGSGKRAGLLSDYTFAVRGPAGEFLNVGKAYVGVTDEQIRDLTARLRRLTTGRKGSVHLVRPEVVLEVAFDAVQASPRHHSGFALRFPRIVRIRDDKTAQEVDTLERVAELARLGAHSAPGPAAGY